MTSTRLIVDGAQVHAKLADQLVAGEQLRDEVLALRERADDEDAVEQLRARHVVVEREHLRASRSVHNRRPNLNLNESEPSEELEDSEGTRMHTALKYGWLVPNCVSVVCESSSQCTSTNGFMFVCPASCRASTIVTTSCKSSLLRAHSSSVHRSLVISHHLLFHVPTCHWLFSGCSVGQLGEGACETYFCMVGALIDALCTSLRAQHEGELRFWRIVFREFEFEFMPSSRH